MQLGWKRVFTCLTLGAALMGCSRLFAVHRPAQEQAQAATMEEPAPLRPGVARVTIGKLGRAGATIWWKSPYEGQSTVSYSRDSHLTPVITERTPPTGEHTAVLEDLAPGTRYYLQVETATPLGVARSAVVSFRTVDPMPVDGTVPVPLTSASP